MSESDILYVSKQTLLNPSAMQRIYQDLTRDYYVTDDWSEDFYVLQAALGFIAVGFQGRNKSEFLLPQIQRSYCVLDWPSAHLSNRSLRKQLRKSAFRITVSENISLVLDRLSDYHGSKNWLCPKYKSLCMQLQASGDIQVSDVLMNPTVFRICSVELYDGDNHLVAGELGYVVGSVFTSLTGFCKRERNISIGKIQIFALSLVLRACGFKFLNLGQPPQNGLMQYKAELGGVEISRSEFIARWHVAAGLIPPDLGKFMSTNVLVSSLV
jgi:Leu/Phe-tRNA-protein transferase